MRSWTDQRACARPAIATGGSRPFSTAAMCGSSRTAVGLRGPLQATATAATRHRTRCAGSIRFDGWYELATLVTWTVFTSLSALRRSVSATHLTARTRSDIVDPVPRILPAGQHHGTAVRRCAGDGFAVFHVRYARGARYPVHGNERASLVFLDRGHCTKRVGSRELELPRGTMLFLPAARMQADSFPLA